MAYRDRALIIDSLGNNWTAANAPAAGATCVASVPAVKYARNHITQLGWSCRNAAAAPFTASLAVRDASIAGTVLATWDIVVVNGTGQQDTFALNIKGLKNSALFVEFGTPAASVTQKVSAAGWVDSLSDG